MPILVQKYGGSSVSDLERVKRVAKKIVAAKREGFDLVVVVSAMGNTTDELLGMARELAESPSRRELDMLLSVGERISMALLSMAIHQEGFEAISLTGSQCGIITTASHSNARIMDVRPFRVQDELARGHIVIVAGYQGTSYKREVTTLGRGGSDTTAVALAAALGAEACEIYSDVDGVFDADPRVVLDAKKLASLSHDEMLEMARAGAKVLNEQAIEFARQAQIALYARSTHMPESRGTIVRPDGFEQRAERAEKGLPAVAVSHTNEGLFVDARGDAVGRVAARIEGLDVVCSNVVLGRTLQTFLNTDNVPEAGELAKELSGVDDVTCSLVGLVSAVGYGIGGRLVWMSEAEAALREGGIEPVAVFCQVARLSWVVSTDQVTAAARILHELL